MTTFALSPADAARVAGPEQGQWTLEDWEQLPDDGNRYEVINGVLYMSKSPMFFHQWILQNLYDEIGLPAKREGIAIPAFAPVGVIMPGTTPVQPDFVLVKAERKGIIQNGRIYGVPDLIIEILSAGNRTYDLETKRTAYAAAGVPEYGVIDAEPRTLAYFKLVAPGQYAEPQIFTEAETITFACLPTLPLAVRKLFEGAPDTTL
jgi:Uma2 family endonuclease